MRGSSRIVTHCHWVNSSQLAWPPNRAPLPDAPVRDARGRPTWLLDALGGETTLLVLPNGPAMPAPVGLRRLVLGADLRDETRHLAKRLDLTPGAAVLVRPDQHLAARWRHPELGPIEAALDRLRGASP